MHYIGTLESGKKFDASYDRGDPFGFTLGAGQVIKGWDQGVEGMCIGEKRKRASSPPAVRRPAACAARHTTAPRSPRTCLPPSLPFSCSRHSARAGLW